MESCAKMSVSVEVGLLSGKKATVNAAKNEKVETLMLRARTELRAGKGRLVDTSGRVLDACTSIEDSMLLTGDVLTLHVGRVQMQAGHAAFTAILGDGSAVTWGYDDHSGGSSAVQDQLKNVQQVQASGKAFAAILGDGSVCDLGFLSLRR